MDFGRPDLIATLLERQSAYRDISEWEDKIQTREIAFRSKTLDLPELRKSTAKALRKVSRDVRLRIHASVNKHTSPGLNYVDKRSFHRLWRCYEHVGVDIDTFATAIFAMPSRVIPSLLEISESRHHRQERLSNAMTTEKATCQNNAEASQASADANKVNPEKPAKGKKNRKRKMDDDRGEQKIGDGGALEELSRPKSKKRVKGEKENQKNHADADDDSRESQPEDCVQEEVSKRKTKKKEKKTKTNQIDSAVDDECDGHESPDPQAKKHVERKKKSKSTNIQHLDAAIDDSDGHELPGPQPKKGTKKKKKRSASAIHEADGHEPITSDVSKRANKKRKDEGNAVDARGTHMVPDPQLSTGSNSASAKDTNGQICNAAIAPSAHLSESHSKQKGQESAKVSILSHQQARSPTIESIDQPRATPDDQAREVDKSNLRHAKLQSLQTHQKAASGGQSSKISKPDRPFARPWTKKLHQKKSHQHQQMAASDSPSQNAGKPNRQAAKAPARNWQERRATSGQHAQGTCHHNQQPKNALISRGSKRKRRGSAVSATPSSIPVTAHGTSDEPVQPRARRVCTPQSRAEQASGQRCVDAASQPTSRTSEQQTDLGTASVGTLSCSTANSRTDQFCSGPIQPQAAAATPILPKTETVADTISSQTQAQSESTGSAEVTCGEGLLASVSALSGYYQLVRAQTPTDPVAGSESRPSASASLTAPAGSPLFLATPLEQGGVLLKRALNVHSHQPAPQKSIKSEGFPTIPSRKQTHQSRPPQIQTEATRNLEAPGSSSTGPFHPTVHHKDVAIGNGGNTSDVRSGIEPGRSAPVEMSAAVNEAKIAHKGQPTSRTCHPNIEDLESAMSNSRNAPKQKTVIEIPDDDVSTNNTLRTEHQISTKTETLSQPTAAGRNVSADATCKDKISDQLRRNGKLGRAKKPFNSLSSPSHPLIPSRPSRKAISGVGQTRLEFPPGQQHYGLVQELLWEEPFFLLVAAQMLNKATIERFMPCFEAFRNKYKTPHQLVVVPIMQLMKEIQHLGQPLMRARDLKRMASMWINRQPGSNPRETFESELRTHHGHYTHDSWRIFCKDVAYGLADDFNGYKAASDSFEPEWKRVLPKDRELRGLLKWMWLKKGWVWNPTTGERQLASEDEVATARQDSGPSCVSKYEQRDLPSETFFLTWQGNVADGVAPVRNELSEPLLPVVPGTRTANLYRFGEAAKPAVVGSEVDQEKTLTQASEACDDSRAEQLQSRQPNVLSSTEAQNRFPLSAPDDDANLPAIYEDLSPSPDEGEANAESGPDAGTSNQGSSRPFVRIVTTSKFTPLNAGRRATPPRFEPLNQSSRAFLYCPAPRCSKKYQMTHYYDRHIATCKFLQA